MQYRADPDAIATFLKRYKTKVYLGLLVLIAVATLFIMINYHNNHNSGYFVFFCIIVIMVIGRFVVTVILRGTKLINTMIDNVEADEKEVVVRTIGISMLFGMAEKERLNVPFARNGIKLNESTAKLPFDEKSTGRVYILTAEGDDYLLAENFFHDFEKIRAEFSDNEP